MRNLNVTITAHHKAGAPLWESARKTMDPGFQSLTGPAAYQGCLQCHYTMRPAQKAFKRPLSARRSASLLPVASPRAQEPKRQTRAGSCFAAIAATIDLKSAIG